MFDDERLVTGRKEMRTIVRIRVIGSILAIACAFVLGCSTTDDAAPQPWDESLAHDMCDPSIEGTSSCDL